MMPDDGTKSGPGVDLEKRRIRFDYIKSNNFRVIHVDGVYGGLSPHGQIGISIWNERWPIPKQVTHKLKDDMNLGEEIEEELIIRNAIVREVEAYLVMDVQIAIVLRDWLDDKIKAIEKAQMEPQGE